MADITVGEASHPFASARGVGPRVDAVTIPLNNSEVEDATPVLRSFRVAFTRPDDRHFGQLNLGVEVAKVDSPGTVTVNCTYGLRDWSDEFDDAYEGDVDFVVIPIALGGETIALGRHDFGITTGESQEATETVILPTPIRDAVAVLTRFQAEFTPRDDHRFGQLKVAVRVEDVDSASGKVTVRCFLGLRDWSDGFDDPYEGTVAFAVLPRDEIALGRHDFGSRKGKPQEAIEIVRLPTPIDTAVVLLTGFEVGFTPPNDHNFGELNLELRRTVVDSSSGKVTVHVLLSLRDWSDEFDDAYEGSILFAVMPVRSVVVPH